MQIREIRWASSGGEEDQRGGRIPVGPGITMMNGEAATGAGFDFWSLQADLVLAPASNQDRILCQFLLSHEDQLLTYTSDQEVPGSQAFFRTTALGGEAELLGSAMDYALLADPSRSSREKKLAIGRLLLDLEDQGREACDPDRGVGRLMSLEADLQACQAEMDRQSHAKSSPHRLQAAIEAGEKEIQAFRAEDGDLAHQQQEEKYLAIKTEYETLLRLREELEETEAREGEFGARITALGHDITVHELTELARMRNESRQVEAEAGQAGQALEEARQARKKAEQDRVLLGRRIQELEEERVLALNRVPVPQTAKFRDPPSGQETFPSTRQLLWLVLALLLAGGLFLAIFVSRAGYVLLGLALLGSLVLLLSRPGRTKPTLVPKDPPQETGPSLEALLATATADLDQTMSRIAHWDEEEVRLAADYERLGRQFRRLDNELLRQLRRYAGPSETEEIDDIIRTLSRQRDSSAYFKENVADLLRRIADLKHGRSEDEMLKEYDKACAMLYGLPDGSGLDGQYLTRRLTHDPQRARRIHEERITLAGLLDQRTQEVAQMKTELKETRESMVALGSLEQRQAALRLSWEESAQDYRVNRLAVAWLQGLMEGIDRIDMSAWMELTLAYLGRLTGRRPAPGLNLPLPQVGQGKIRPPRMEEGRGPQKAALAADPSFFRQAPPSLRYLAARLALTAIQSQEGLPQVPLIAFNPGLPDGNSYRDYLLDVLEEWALGTGGQLVYFTGDKTLISLASGRRMNISVWG